MLACGEAAPAAGGIDTRNLIPARAAVHKAADQLQFVELSWSEARLMRYREWAPHSRRQGTVAGETPVWVVGLEGSWLRSGGQIVNGRGLGVFEAATGIFLEGWAEEGSGQPAGWDQLPDHQAG
jgi:hypothetical protein